MYIYMRNGTKILVDAGDYEEMNKYNWYLSKGKYAQTRINGKQTSMHRIIAGATKGVMVDHVNGDTLDNRKSNLRLCTNGQNLANRGKPKGKYYSIYKGVTLDKRCGRWMAKITKNYKTINLGYYSNEIEAAAAYNNKAIELFGEFAKINDLGSDL